jgi:hypothetical protein
MREEWRSIQDSVEYFEQKTGWNNLILIDLGRAGTRRPTKAATSIARTPQRLQGC